MTLSTNPTNLRRRMPITMQLTQRGDHTSRENGKQRRDRMALVSDSVAYPGDRESSNHSGGYDLCTMYNDR